MFNHLSITIEYHTGAGEQWNGARLLSAKVEPKRFYCFVLHILYFTKSEQYVSLVNILKFTYIYITLCAIWYHFYNVKNFKNSHGGVLLLVKLQTSACSFTESSTSPWVFSRFLKKNKRNFQELISICQKLHSAKTFLLKNAFFMFFANFIFCCFKFENTPSCSFKCFESSDIILVKKKSLLKVY